jgi:hypothetical protein
MALGRAISHVFQPVAEKSPAEFDAYRDCADAECDARKGRPKKTIRTPIPSFARNVVDLPVI